MRGDRIVNTPFAVSFKIYLERINETKRSKKFYIRDKIVTDYAFLMF